MKSKLLIASLILFAISCNKKDKLEDFSINDAETSEFKQPGTANSLFDEKAPIPVGKYSPLSVDTTGSPVHNTVSANIDWDKKIIKNATLKLEIKNYQQYNEFIHQSLKQYGAYIAHEQQFLSEDRNETQLTIKVPVSQFENLMNKLPGNEDKVIEKSINTEDVTGEVIDTKSRLEARKAMRLKYMEFLKQSKNMAEVLQVQNEINSIQEEIEAAAGRINYLSHQTAYSTINLTYYQPLEGFVNTDKEPSFFGRLALAFKGGLQWLGELFVAIVSIWPLWLIIAGILFGWKNFRTKKTLVQKV